jgi:hypothetical protein
VASLRTPSSNSFSVKLNGKEVNNPLLRFFLLILSGVIACFGILFAALLMIVIPLLLIPLVLVFGVFSLIKTRPRS